jgi:pimeloyl-ACP methyl ester carboxylesterase
MSYSSARDTTMHNNPTLRANAKGSYASVNGINMYYETAGQGFPLVLIHGGGSTLDTSFAAVMPALAETHRVIAVDMQAHGRTSDRDAPETFAQDAADILELLRQLEIDQADILGFSNGGHTAMEIAIEYPERVRKLVLVSMFYNRAGAFPGFWDGFPTATLAQMPQVYQDEYLALGNSQADLQNMFNKDVERMSNFVDWTEQDVKSISAPTWIVIGDQDVTTPEHAVQMHRLIQGSRLTIFPSSHGNYIGEAMSRDATSPLPNLFVALLNDFLAA